LKSNKNINYFGIPPSSPQDLQGTVINSQVYEHEDIAHGISCTCCTKIKDSQRLEEEYQNRIKQLHKGKYKGVRAQKAKRQAEKQQLKQDDVAFSASHDLLPKQDESDPMEDIAPI
jgi:hypothetical protein